MEVQVSLVVVGVVIVVVWGSRGVGYYHLRRSRISYLVLFFGFSAQAL